MGVTPRSRRRSASGCIRTPWRRSKSPLAKNGHAGGRAAAAAKDRCWAPSRANQAAGPLPPQMACCTRSPHRRRSWWSRALRRRWAAHHPAGAQPPGARDPRQPGADTGVLELNARQMQSQLDRRDYEKLRKSLEESYITLSRRNRGPPGHRAASAGADQKESSWLEQLCTDFESVSGLVVERDFEWEPARSARNTVQLMRWCRKR